MDEWVKKMPHTHTQSKCPSMDEWTTELWSIHTEAYHPTTKRNEPLTHATGMNLQNKMLSERSLTQEATNCMILSIGNIHNR